MKTEKTLRLVGALAVAAGTLVGCGGGSTVSAPDAAAANVFNIKANAITLNAVDASTGNLLQQSVTATYTGGLVGDLAVASGDLVTSQTFKNGITNFYTNQTGVLGVTSASEGYLPGSISLDVYGKTAFGVLQMINIATPPTGVTINTVSANVTGNLTDSANVYAGRAAAGLATVATGKAFFKPALGSVFRLRTNEQAIGLLNFLLANYDVSKAQNSIPGGLYVKNNGSFDPIIFAGAVSLRWRANVGGDIVSVSPAALLRIPVAGTNPTTGKPFAVGDVMNIVNLPSGATEWASAGTAVVAQGDEGLHVLVSASIPGSWGVGIIQPAGCSQGVTFNFPKLGGLNLDVTLARTGWSQTFPTAGRTSVRLQGIPVGKSVSFNVAYQGQTINFSSSRTFSCGEEVSISDTIDAVVSKASFKLNAICEDGRKATDNLANFPLILSNAGKFAGAGYSDANGAIEIKGLSTGVTYKYVIPLQPLGDITGTLVANGGSIEVKLPCPSLTGATGATGD